MAYQISAYLGEKRDKGEQTETHTHTHTQSLREEDE